MYIELKWLHEGKEWSIKTCPVQRNWSELTWILRRTRKDWMVLCKKWAGGLGRIWFSLQLKERPNAKTWFMCFNSTIFMLLLAKTIKEFLELMWISRLGLEGDSHSCRCRGHSSLIRWAGESWWFHCCHIWFSGAWRWDCGAPLWCTCRCSQLVFCCLWKVNF